MRSMMKGLLGGALAASCSSGLSSHHDDPPREQQSTGRTRRSSSQLGGLVNNSQLPLARPPVSPLPPAHPLTPVLLVRPPCALDLWRNVIFRQKRRAQSHPIIAVNLWFTVCVCVWGDGVITLSFFWKLFFVQGWFHNFYKLVYFGNLMCQHKPRENVKIFLSPDNRRKTSNHAAHFSALSQWFSVMPFVPIER